MDSWKALVDMANGTRTGVRIDYGEEIMDFADWNNLVKYIDNGLARVLLQHMMADGILTASADPLTLDTTTKRFTAPVGSTVVAGLVAGRQFYMDATHEGGGTVTTGNAGYIIDTGLINPNDFWNGAYVIFTSGTYSGQIRAVSDYNSSTNKLSWLTPLSGAPAIGDTYVVTFFYIQSLTNSALNYIYGSVSGNTPSGQLLSWVANTTGVKPASSILVATMTLDSDGLVTASDNNPTDADRVSYKGIGAHDVITLTGTITGLAAGGSSQLTRTHAYLLYRGGIRYTLGNENLSLTMDQCWEPDTITFTISNDASYPINVAYTVYVEGWKRRYFSV